MEDRGGEEEMGPSLWKGGGRTSYQYPCCCFLLNLYSGYVDFSSESGEYCLLFVAEIEPMQVLEGLK